MSQPPYPEHEKMSAIRDKSQSIGQFLDWASEQGWHLAEWEDEYPHRMTPVGLRIEQVLAAYFDIDLDRIATEKEQMYQSLRESAEKNRAGV